MNIILPVIDNKSGKDEIAEGFHNAEHACIYNNTNNSFEWLAVKDITNEPGNLTLELKRKDIYTVISNHIMPMALALFIESGLKVYKARGKSVKENIKLFNENQLESFSFHVESDVSYCHTSCGPCSSSCK